MTDLWYIKRSDFVRFETLKCPAIVLKLTKNFVLKFTTSCWDPCTVNANCSPQQHVGVNRSCSEECNSSCQNVNRWVNL